MRPLPIAILIPHAGLQIPPEVADRVVLTPDEIFTEADAYADRLFDFGAAVRTRRSFPYARAVIDVNRSPHAGANRPGDGIVKAQTSYGRPVYRAGAAPDAALIRRLEVTYWQPWHAALAAIAADRAVRLVIDAHSMAALGPSQYDDPGRLRPRVAVSNLGGPDGRPRGGRDRGVSAPPVLTRRLAAALGAQLAAVEPLAPVGPDAAVNAPFVGGWDLAAHGGGPQPWLMVEVNRALYLGSQSADSPAMPPDLDRIDTVRRQLWQAIERLLTA